MRHTKLRRGQLVAAACLECRKRKTKVRPHLQRVLLDARIIQFISIVASDRYGRSVPANVQRALLAP